ncbi:uncharacterized protein LOC131235693 [Magnolia sinica]|uniref:uncharacterized protein LOC131235693 n=1 Tax=Magnolia sinica TaxID=86752 RepID=UPI00265B0E4A|nr:uncharacterized protein LOC131235693 [Magnolia sinica]
MAKEEEGEDPSSNSCSRKKRLRRKLSSSLPPRKRLISNPPPSLKTLSKNTPSIFPNFSNCHSCKTRSSILKEGADRLQTLPSNWRVVLLCPNCLYCVESAQICSYCLAKISRDEDGLDCQECDHRVHRGCIPNHHRGSLPRPMSVKFTCIDCWAPKSPVGSKGGVPSGHSCSRRRSSLEDVVKDANLNAAKAAEAAARAKEMALKKAAAARRAAELARSALDLAVFAAREESGSTSVVDDEELALLLHRAMNSSPRISKALGLLNFNGLVGPRNRECNRSDSGSHSVCGKLEVCTDVKLSRNDDKTDAEPSVGVGTLDRNSSVAEHGVMGSSEVGPEAGPVEKFVVKDDKSEIMPMKEEQASCSNMVVNSSGDDNCVDSGSGSCQKLNGSMNKVSSKCSGPQCRSGDDGDSSRLQKKRCRAPDPYLKKFSKKHSSIKAFLARVMSSA